MGFVAGQTTTRFGRVYTSFDPDGPGGGPSVWLLGTAGDGSSSSAVISAGIYDPAATGNAPLGAPVYFKAPGVLALAQAVDATTPGDGAPHQAIGLLANVCGPGDAAGVIADGRLTRADWSAVMGAAALVSGERYYLSAVQAGQLRPVCPSTPGATVVALGQALDPQTIEVEINRIVRLEA